MIKYYILSYNYGKNKYSFITSQSNLRSALNHYNLLKNVNYEETSGEKLCFVIQDGDLYIECNNIADVSKKLGGVV